MHHEFLFLITDDFADLRCVQDHKKLLKLVYHVYIDEHLLEHNAQKLSDFSEFRVINLTF